ncbi:MAG: alkaline phosphatase family protein [Desulfarculus sp.]|nr:alkaline phosphatase family protein [Desulfarculus sp.]
MSRHLAIIGLDCAEPSLVFGPWRPRLPHLAALMGRGRWGRLASCHPPITVPAWACMASGLDPGQLGLYGFHNRAGHHYGELALASQADLQAPCLWDLAGAAGLTSVVLGVPLTYPPRPIRGALVAGFPAPAGAALTWPRSLGPLLERWAGGPYLPDIEGFRHLKPADLLAQAETMARRRFAVAQGLYRQYGPEVFMLVEMSSDRVQHALWDAHGPGQEAIARHYEVLDGLVGDPAGAVPPAEAAALKAEITARLEAMPGPDGRPLGNQVLDPTVIYRQTRGCPPDLMLYPGGLSWRASGLVQPGEGAGFFLAHNDTGPDQANHAPQGILIAGLAGGGTLAQAGQEVTGASLHDVLPSALAWLGIQNLDREAGPGRAWRWLC